MTLSPRLRKGLALLLAWAGISLLFFSLARPVREWAGHHWNHYVLAAAIFAVVACAGAWHLWEQR